MTPDESFEQACREVADRGITVDMVIDSVRSRRKDKVTAALRSAVFYRMREDGHSLPKIAEACHLKHHTTVLHSLRRWEKEHGDG